MICRDLGFKRWPYNGRREMKKNLKKNSIKLKGKDGCFFEFTTFPRNNKEKLYSKFEIKPSKMNIQVAVQPLKVLPSFSELINGLDQEKQKK